MRLFVVKLPSQYPEQPIIDSLLEAVDEETRLRAGRFRLKEDRLRCLVGRFLPQWYSRTVLRRSECLRIERTLKGRPYIAAPSFEPTLDYNISHDGEIVLMAVTRGSGARIGVDVLKVLEGNEARDTEEALEDQLHPRELATLRQLPLGSAARSELLASLWTMKEAYTKALGEGLSFEFNRIASAFGLMDGNEQVEIDGKEVSADWLLMQGMVYDRSGKRYQWAVAEQGGGPVSGPVSLEEVEWEDFMTSVAC